MNKNRQWAVKPMVPEEIYTDRQEFLDYLYQAALDAIGRRTMSTVLLGQRRMGKTEIFKRVVNRLFFEQDHTDPQAVVPVFFTFPDEVISRENFALKYVENFVRWYVAFRLRKLEILSTPRKPHELAEYIRPLQDISDGFKKRALSLLTAIEEGGVNLPEEKVNVMGGSTAIGHPLGATMIRLPGTLARILKDKKAKYGMANACVGGGQGVATLIENIDA